MEPRPIKNNSLPEDGVIGVGKQVVQFIQKNDTFGEIDKYQQMKFETMGLEYDKKDNCDWFFRVSTGGEADEELIEPFWSLNGPEELVYLFNEVAKRTDMRCRWKCEKYYIDNKSNEE